MRNHHGPPCGGEVLMNYETVLRRLLAELAGRVGEDVVMGVLEELDAGEPTVAVEWLCDALFEDDVVLTSEEADVLIDCLAATGSTRYTGDELRELSAR